MKETVLSKSIYMETLTEGGEGIKLFKIFSKNEAFPCLVRERYGILNPENKTIQINLYTSNSEEPYISYRNADKLGNILLKIPVWRESVVLEFKCDMNCIEIKVLDEENDIMNSGCIEIN